MADDDLLSSAGSDDDLLLDSERETPDDKNPLLEAEKDSVDEEEFSEPKGLDELGSDPGSVDEETIFAGIYEKGAGADMDAEDINELGMHVEEFADEDSANFDELEDYSIDEDEA